MQVGEASLHHLANVHHAKSCDQWLQSSTLSSLGACSSMLWSPAASYVSILGALILTVLSVCWFLFALRCRRCRVSGGLSSSYERTAAAAASTPSSSSLQSSSLGGAGAGAGGAGAAAASGAVGMSNPNSAQSTSIPQSLLSTTTSSAASRASSHHYHPYSPRLPGLSVITPIKGVHVDSLDNWRSVIETDYDGDIEFIFVVESSDDPAYLPLKQLQSEAISSCNKNLTGVKVAVAGMGFHCSQKIHNMLEGVSLVDKQSMYVLFLDDDVALYRNTFRDLVLELERDPKVFVSTGFPYDYLAPPPPPFSSYLKLVYRFTSLLLLFRDRVPVVWGGCMCMRREDLHSNRYGMMEAWRDRGYSDDMIVGSVCVKENRTVALPPTCIFPHKLGHHDSISNYWNFLCRQMFVLDTYHNNTEKMQNYILLFVVSVFLPLSCVMMFLLTLARSSVIVSANIIALVVSASNNNNNIAAAAGEALVAAAAGNDVNSQDKIASVVSGSFATVISPDISLDNVVSSFPVVICGWISFILVALSVRQTAIEALSLCNYLLPQHKHIPVIMPSFFKSVLAFLIHHIFHPSAAFFGYFSTNVTWSGVTYFVEKGMIVKVSRKTPEGREITTRWEKSLEEAAVRHASRGFLVGVPPLASSSSSSSSCINMNNSGSGNNNNNVSSNSDLGKL